MHNNDGQISWFTSSNEVPLATKTKINWSNLLDWLQIIGYCLLLGFMFGIYFTISNS